MKVLVTGGCGFIGSHLIEHHLNQGDYVMAVDNLSTGSIKNIAGFETNPHFQFVKADITNWPELENVVKRVDVIYHMAAVVGMQEVIRHQLRDLEVNILGCERLLKTIVAAKVKPTVLIASTSSVYGNNAKQPSSETDDLSIESAIHPLSCYPVSKLANESLARAYFLTYQLPVVTVRLFNTIGTKQTGRYGMVVPRFVQSACKNETITIYGDGKQTRCFCDVHDVIKALQLLLNNPKCYGDIFNVGNDNEISIENLALLVRKLANSRSDFEYVSYQKVYGPDSIDIQRRRPDVNKLYQYTGFRPCITLEETIKELILNYHTENIKTKIL